MAAGFEEKYTPNYKDLHKKARFRHNTHLLFFKITVIILPAGSIISNSTRGCSRGYILIKGRLVMKARILWIEGKRAEGPSFIPGLRKKGYVIETVPTGKAALERMVEVCADIVVVNAASLRTSGKRICQTIREQLNGMPILLIAEQDRPVAKEVEADVVLNLPFTVRKLVNRINPLLPSDEENLLQVGSISLDIANKRVRCEKKEARLTPRLARLLTIFLQHPGEVLEREHLFREIWKTEYTGDTRTLDVHISWLRQAIEENPRKPRFLKTIRGVGYRLDI